MNDEGTICLWFASDANGNLTATVVFTPDGSDVSTPLSDPLPVTDGGAICIGPCCVKCYMETSVWSDGAQGMRKTVKEAPKKPTTVARPMPRPASPHAVPKKPDVPHPEHG